MMESLPNELLSLLMDHFDAETLKVGRLVSSRWNKFAEHRLKRDFQISIHDALRLHAFMKTFDRTPLPHSLPVKNFHFTGTLLLKKTSRKLLEKFCACFGHLVTGLELYGQFSDKYNRVKDRVDPEAELLFVKYTNLFLCHCENIEELTVVPRRNFVNESLKNLPTLPKLRSITVKYAIPGKSETYRNCTVSQIAANAPSLSNVSISFLYFGLVAQIISKLVKINSKIGLKLLSMRIPATEDSKKALLDLIAISFPLRISELDLHIAKGFASTGMVTLLTKWLSTFSGHLKSLYVMGLGEITSMGVLSLPVLEDFKAANVKFYKVYLGTFQLPQLKRLVLLDDVDVTPFIGSVFPYVLSAELLLQDRKQVEHWPLIIPNVEDLELYVTNDTLHGIFGFTNVVKLEVHIDSDEDDPDHINYPSSWEQLTAGTADIADSSICTIPLDNYNSTTLDGDRRNFRALTRLQRLKFMDGIKENSDCWKAVIYASRTGLLRRLDKLVFGFHDMFASEYCETLKNYHDVVELNIEYDSDCEYSEQDYDNGNWNLHGGLDFELEEF